MAHIKFRDFVNEARNPKLTYKEKTAKDKTLTQIDVLINETEDMIEFKQELLSLMKRFKNLDNASKRVKVNLESSKGKLLDFVNTHIFDVEDRLVTRKLYVNNAFMTISKITEPVDITETKTTIDYEKILKDITEAVSGIDKLIEALTKANTKTEVTFTSKDSQKEPSPKFSVTTESVNFEEVNENAITDIYAKVKEWVAGIKKIFSDTDSSLKALGKTIQKYEPKFEVPDFSDDKIVQTGIRDKIVKFMKIK